VPRGIFETPFGTATASTFAISVVLPSCTGTPGLHGAFSDFCARWSEGIDQLVGDAGIIGESLLATESYRSVDEAGSSAFDPGVSSR